MKTLTYLAAWGGVLNSQLATQGGFFLCCEVRVAALGPGNRSGDGGAAPPLPHLSCGHCVTAPYMEGAGSLFFGRRVCFPNDPNGESHSQPCANRGCTRPGVQRCPLRVPPSPWPAQFSLVTKTAAVLVGQWLPRLPESHWRRVGASHASPRAGRRRGRASPGPCSTAQRGGMPATDKYQAKHTHGAHTVSRTR